MLLHALGLLRRENDRARQQHRRIARTIDAAQAERVRRRQIAERRSFQLLMSKLSLEQRATCKLNGWFEVRGSHTKRTYRILITKFLANVLDTRRRIKYCLAFEDRTIPLGDHVLAQKLLIETNEPGFLRIANPESF